MNADKEPAGGGTLAMERLRQLVLAAQQGDRSVLPQLRRALDEDPRLWKDYGNLALQAQESWLRVVAGNDLWLEEALRRQLGALRSELEGPAPSPLERLLIERIVACWLQCSHADAVAGQATGPQYTPAMLRELQRRQESGQRRLLDAVKKLALVRKLLKPGPSPLDLAMRQVAEAPAVRLRRTTAPAEGEPVLN